MKKIRYAFTFYGQVQGVGFRYTASHAASRYDLRGWVKNEYDGSVSAEVQGTENGINQWLGILSNDRFIGIERIEKKEIPLRDDERGFGVKY